LLLAAMTLVASGCKKEEDPPDPEEFAALSFDAEQVLEKIPDGLKNSDDEYAQDCYQNIEDALDMSDFIGQMEVPDNAVRTDKKSTGGTWRWTWNYAGQSYTFYWTYEESGGKRWWTMEIQMGSGPRYDYITAWEMMDGSEGEVEYNFEWALIAEGEEYDEGDFVFWRYHWKLDTTGKYTFNWIVDSSDSEYETAWEYDVVVNDDGSGSISYYLMDELFYFWQWNTDGSGSWEYYIDGDVFMSGTWAAG